MSGWEININENEIRPMAERFRMASKQDWRGFKEFYVESNKQNHMSSQTILLQPVTVNGDNAFNVAAKSGDTQLFGDLLDMLFESGRLEALKSTDLQGNTPLHEVATTDDVPTAKLIISVAKTCKHGEKDECQSLKELLGSRNKLGETALYRAAAFGRTRMVRYLAKQIETVGSIRRPADGNLSYLQRHFSRDSSSEDGHDKLSILHIAVIGQHFDTAKWLLNRDPGLAEKEDNNGMTSLQLLASMPAAFLSTSPMNGWQKLIYDCLEFFRGDDDDDNKDEADDDEHRLNLKIRKNQSGNRQHNACRIVHKIRMEKRKHKLALQLVTRLVKEDLSWMEICTTRSFFDDSRVSLKLCKGETKESSKADNKVTLSQAPQVPLILASIMGITEIFDKIVDTYPQAVDFVNEEGRNILHYAILFRQKEIFERIIKMKMSVGELASRIDVTGNTILHCTAYMTFYSGGTRPGPVLQFQEELEWYQRVKKLVPSHYTMHRNSYGNIAEELFEEQHEEQHQKAQQWMKDTVQSCSTVAILMATLVFAAAYTVPGGMKQENARPALLDNPLFLVFVISLGGCLTSVVLFLSILTSPFRQKDFLRSLPRKLTIGFSCLFFSLLTTMVTFTISILLTVRLEEEWTAFLIYAAALIPVVIFALIMFPWYAALTGTSINVS